MRPVRWLSRTLQITRPRQALDDALGKTQHNSSNAFSAFTVPPQTTTPTTAHATRSTTPGKTPRTVAAPRHAPGPVFFHPTSKRPLRIYIAGDSLSLEYGLALGRTAAASPTLEMEGNVDYHVSTGISRPDFFNWPVELAQQMAARKPDVVVFMVGANDDQALVAPDGHTYRPFSPGWQREYARRAGVVMDEVISTGRSIVWVGTPIIGNAARSAGYHLMDGLVKQEAARRRGAFFLDSYPLFQDGKGAYQQYLPNASGQLVKMRADDNIHFERAGGEKLAAATVAILDHAYKPLP
jgi:hypothetical protein